LNIQAAVSQVCRFSLGRLLPGSIPPSALWEIAASALGVSKANSLFGVSEWGKGMTSPLEGEMSRSDRGG